MIGADGTVDQVVNFAAETYPKTEAARRPAMIDAIRRSNAVIEFDLDGTILDAKQVFCDVITPPRKSSASTTSACSCRGRRRRRRPTASSGRISAAAPSASGDFHRCGKGGRSLAPCHLQSGSGADGNLVGVVKYALDVTDAKRAALDAAGQLAAPSTAPVRSSNSTSRAGSEGEREFLRGPRLRACGELTGRHHGIFLTPEDRESPQYRAFWTALSRGEFQEGEFRRVAKDGREVWIQATYNPILDADGRPFGRGEVRHRRLGAQTRGRRLPCGCREPQRRQSAPCCSSPCRAKWRS
ncbi:MAG: PAS domain-containing protein [Paracoccaceae bacterium]